MGQGTHQGQRNGPRSAPRRPENRLAQGPTLDAARPSRERRRGGGIRAGKDQRRSRLGRDSLLSSPLLPLRREGHKQSDRPPTPNKARPGAEATQRATPGSFSQASASTQAASLSLSLPPSLCKGRKDPLARLGRAVAGVCVCGKPIKTWRVRWRTADGTTPACKNSAPESRPKP